VTFSIIHGDVLAALRAEPDASFDALYSDVPYGLGPRQPTGAELISYLQGEEMNTGGDFMGRRWHVPSVNVWREVFRVLKPGAPLLVNAAPRTEDLVALGMRAAGFEIADIIMWMFASAMPKSLDLSKAIDSANGDERPVVGPHPSPSSTKKRVAMGDGWQENPQLTSAASAASAAWSGYGTALAPGYEPVILAWKPNEGTYAENAARYGVGGLAIDAARINFADENDETTAKARNAHASFGSAAPVRTTYGKIGAARENYDPPGRWPKNVILDPEAGAMIDAAVGDRPGMSGGGKHRKDYAGGMFGGIDSTSTARGDNGGPSRFYFCAKSSRTERDLGCEHLPLHFPAETVGREEDSVGIKSGRAGAGRTGNGVHNPHPNCKPIELTKYLARMVLPPPREHEPRCLLVPYCGSGSEIVGALIAGWDHVVGIERDATFIPIAEARCTLAATNPRAFDVDVRATKTEADPRQPSLFGKPGS